MSRTEPAATTRIVGIEAFLVRLPLVHARARKSASRDRPRFARHALVRVTDRDGAAGWGEVPDVDTALWQALVEEHGPALLRHSWKRPTEVEDAFTGLGDLPAVRAGLDTACWDLWSGKRGTPLSHALGGNRTAVTAGVTLARQPSEESLVREVNRHVGSGFQRVRLDVEPGWDVEPVRAVQERFPFLVLQANAEGRYTEETADLEALRALDSYGLLAIEQPFPAPDLAAHARLRRELRTPVALNTSVASLADLDEAIRQEAGGALNVRMSRLGGLTQARRAHDRAVDAGWDVWCGSDGESGLGRASLVALASLPGVTLPSEMPGAGGRFSRETAQPPVRAQDGVVPVPLTRPGAGHDVDRKALDALTERSATVGSPAG
ncbi:O-succinylbenzoate synthase [Haloactinospora alba]|uniref:O-succinylbenzoate synthase n=1 Tax=Haloactinospora alba TaxID=405555 RepID=A0A543NJY7_9ACTN|nr:enolase C-terminal domain-like protein [Haloactinospora alba]TQN32127.1 O-succinylbenzoate synthase [Haloactinospora alba]